MGIAERVDKVPYLENQDSFVTSSMDWEVASDSFSVIYQIAVFGWLHIYFFIFFIFFFFRNVTLGRFVGSVYSTGLPVSPALHFL